MEIIYYARECKSLNLILAISFTAQLDKRSCYHAFPHLVNAVIYAVDLIAM